MTTILERPPTISPPNPPAPPAASPEPPAPSRPRRSLWQRYQHHAWIGGIAVLVIISTALPVLLMPQVPASQGQSREPVRAAAVPAANLTTNVNITATEFKVTPSSVQVPLGQKVTFSLNNTGVVEHDITIQSVGFTVLAKPGQTATGEFTFDKPGVFDFICSIPGHKEAGMKGTLTVVEPGAATPAAAEATHDMSGMGTGMGTGTTPSADIQPLPANLSRLPLPQVAPAITRTEPAYIKYDLTTQKVTAQMADGVAYEYWTFKGTVPARCCVSARATPSRLACTTLLMRV